MTSMQLHNHSHATPYSSFLMTVILTLSTSYTDSILSTSSDSTMSTLSSSVTQYILHQVSPRKRHYALLPALFQTFYNTCSIAPCCSPIMNRTLIFSVCALTLASSCHKHWLCSTVVLTSYCFQTLLFLLPILTLSIHRHRHVLSDSQFLCSMFLTTVNVSLSQGTHYKHLTSPHHYVDTDTIAIPSTVKIETFLAAFTSYSLMLLIFLLLFWHCFHLKTPTLPSFHCVHHLHLAPVDFIFAPVLTTSCLIYLPQTFPTNINSTFPCIELDLSFNLMWMPYWPQHWLCLVPSTAGAEHVCLRLCHSNDEVTGLHVNELSLRSKDLPYLWYWQ